MYFKIVSENLKPILGANSYEKVLLVKRVQELEIAENLFEGLVCIINLDLAENPSFEISPARRVAFKIQEQVKTELDNMVNMGVIEPTHVPSPVYQT